MAVDPERCDQPVRCFTTFTEELYRLADWLKSMEVEVVAMESTGYTGSPV